MVALAERDMGNERVDGALKYIHYRKIKGFTTALCGHEGQHTTTVEKKVTCVNCRNLMELRKRVKVKRDIGNERVDGFVGRTGCKAAGCG